MTVQARGAQRLGTRCLRYDSAHGRFTFRWRLGTRTGPVRIGLQLTYPAVTSVWQQITIGAK